MTFLSALLAADTAKAAAPGAESTGPGTDIINLFGSFGVDKPHLIVQIVNFTILAFVLYRFAIKPALGQLEERIRQAEQLQKDRSAAEAQLASAQKTAEAKLVAASEEATKILVEARNSAKATIEASRAEAQAAQTEVIAKATAAIEADRVKMMNEVRGEVSRLVVETAAKVLEQNLDDSMRGRLNEAAVKQLAR
ncbi:ATP synthase subunit b [Opitutia bacterium]|nr:ATP synthase subunit b [Opitutae bacterium]